MIEIRNPTNQEVNVIVDILTDIFSDKFSHIFQNDLENGKLVICKFYKDSSYEELSNYFVAVEHDRVLGVIHLTYYGAKENSSLSSIIYTLQKLGIFRGIKATVAFALLDFKDFNKSSCFVDFVGILPVFQGRGIGKLLLKKAEEFARYKKFHILSLNVIGKNKGAIKLYQKLGFKKIKYNKSVLGRLFFGIKDFFYMEKILQ